MNFGVRTLAAGLLILLVASVVGCARRDGGDETFPVFRERFIRDEAFRVSRISLPLLVLVGSPSESRAAQTWSLEQVKERFTVPLPKDQLQTKGLVESTLTSTPTEVELLQSKPQSDSYLLKYRFELKGGQWFLTYFEASSY
jgi:hypothetical protein